MKMITPRNVADYFLTLNDPEGDLISNLKLQKLVYYAQGFHLAMFGKPFFEDDILAWEHGPVVEDLYHQFKEYGSKAIPTPKSFNSNVFSQKQKELLNDVNEVYGQFSAWKLRNMTHSERPWVETKRNRVISKELMQEFFKDYII
jgi:uncharacterized phage-associated protein